MVTEDIGKNKAEKKNPKKNFGINIGSNAGSLPKARSSTRCNREAKYPENLTFGTEQVFFFNWSIVDSQSTILCFRRAAKWFSYICVQFFFQILFPYVCVLSPCSSLQLFVTPRTVAPQAPLSMGFPRQKYWNGLPFPSPGDLLNPGIESASPVSPVLQADYLLLSHQGSPFPIQIIIKYWV